MQLAHTTNLPLTYEIYTASEWAQKTTRIKEANAQELQYPDQTYNTGDQVQTNAQPLYWLAKRTANSKTGIDYYVLVVSWTDTNVTNKDTEMIYISASLGGDSNA